MILEPGKVVDSKYRITCQLGAGGMAAVYEAENLLIRRRVAIKVLHAATLAKPDLIQRFEREAQAAGQIGNDHIVEVLDMGRLPDGAPYMVMEKLVGETLSDRLKRVGRMEAGQIAPIVRQVLRGLEAAHAAGIVHRDLKPSNIFILKEKAEQKDFVKIIDFGISKFQELTDADHTHSGMLLGSPQYIAPEQADNSRAADARSDLYSVGVMIYQALSGQAPFDASSLREVLLKIMLHAPPPLRELVPDVDPEFAQIISRAMAREPAYRFQQATEFIAALDAWTEGRPIPQPAFDAETVMDAPVVGTPSSPGLVDTDSRRLPPAGELATARSWASTQAGRLRRGELNTAHAVGIGVAAAVVIFALVLVGYLTLRAKPEAARAAPSTSAVATPAAIAPGGEIQTPEDLPESVPTPDDLERVPPDSGVRAPRHRHRRRRAAAPAPAPSPPAAPAPTVIPNPRKSSGRHDWGY